MKIAISILVGFFCWSSMANTVPLDMTQSKLTWTGKKKIGDKHVGQVKLKSGTVTLTGDKVTGGEFVIDMTSITNQDLKGDWNKKLVTHLKSEDFFNTTKHPTATFVVTKVTPMKANKYKVDGKLTIRGKTNPESFEATITKKGKAMMAKGDLKFDRLKYGITYNSETNIVSKAIKIAKDKIISDQVELSFNMATSGK